ncbi:hypothetical protein L917_21667 [Phytophthora nicotianae]|uniref:Uncharacterized protein n=1 Tax=Phytophthora nicotianae TaxID=4792 RepID=W2JYK4_PHYNI|nr:hypothetical protein L917_21667 [Phytophthora nicotianae]
MPASLLKRRYRSRQLEQALDKEEEGLTGDIYDVDQYVAKWCAVGRSSEYKTARGSWHFHKIVTEMTSESRSQ